MNNMFIDNSKYLNEDGKIDFQFEWEPIGFKEIPSNILNLAYKIVELGLLIVENELDEENDIIIKYSYLCYQGNVLDKFNSYLVNEDMSIYRVSTKTKFSKCGMSKKCKLSHCVLSVAGYIYYLKYKSGLKMDYELTDEEKFKRNLNSIKKVHKDEKLEKILTPLLSNSVNSLYLSIETEENVGELDICRGIAKFLYEIGKISNKYILNVTYGEVLEEYKKNKKEAFPESRLIVIRDIEEGADSTQLGSFDSDSNKKIDLKKEVIECLGNISDRYIILLGESLELKRFLNSNEKLIYKFINNLKLNPISSEQIYEIVLNNLNGDLAKKIDIDIKNSIVEYIDDNRNLIPFKNMELGYFLANQMNYSNSIDLPEIFKKHISLEESFEDFVGMNELKKEIYKLQSYLKFKKQAEKNNIQLPDTNLHMVFAGNPGTGKTIIARAISNLLFELGYIKTNKLVEVEKKDLVAAYTGQTAIKTSRVINSALDGVLFIDEAYSLAQGDSFSQEAVTTLIKAMEDYKDSLVVILAGYNEEMKEFVNLNPGISSRIGYTFNFVDYNTEELYEILTRKINKYGFVLDEDAIEPIKAIIRFFASVENFGNGRFIDRLIQSILIKHSMDYEEVTLNIIREKDIPTIKEIIEVNFYSNQDITLPSDITKEDRMKITYHEIGHALINIVLQTDRKIKEITVVPEGGGTLGYVLYENKKKPLCGQQEIINKIVGLLGGMAAEKIIFNQTYGGAGSDLKKANSLAERLLVKYKVSEKIFPLGSLENINKNEYISSKLEEEKEKLLNVCYNQAESILRKNKDVLVELSNILMEKGSMSGDEIEEIALKLLDSKNIK